MQQTKTYKLNLIESTDTFSPTPLNENTQAVEDILADQAILLAEHAGTLAQLTDADLKLITGAYTGNGTVGNDYKNRLTFPFPPKLVLIMGDAQFCLFLRGCPLGLGQSCDNTSVTRFIQTATWSGNVLSWYNSASNGVDGSFANQSNHQFNKIDTVYHYLAIG